MDSGWNVKWDHAERATYEVTAQGRSLERKRWLTAVTDNETVQFKDFKKCINPRGSLHGVHLKMINIQLNVFLDQTDSHNIQCNCYFDGM